MMIKKKIFIDQPMNQKHIFYKKLKKIQTRINHDETKIKIFFDLLKLISN
jgi:hypothetical protein